MTHANLLDLIMKGAKEGLIESLKDKHFSELQNGWRFDDFPMMIASDGLTAYVTSPLSNNSLAISVEEGNCIDNAIFSILLGDPNLYYFLPNNWKEQWWSGWLKGRIQAAIDNEQWWWLTLLAETVKAPYCDRDVWTRYPAIFDWWLSSEFKTFYDFWVFEITDCNGSLYDTHKEANDRFYVIMEDELPMIELVSSSTAFSLHQQVAGAETLFSNV